MAPLKIDVLTDTFGSDEVTVQMGMFDTVASKGSFCYLKVKNNSNLSSPKKCHIIQEKRHCINFSYLNIGGLTKLDCLRGTGGHVDFHGGSRG